MSTSPVFNEAVSRRILGSFVCVDAMTGSSIQQPIPVTAGPWTVAPNRSGVYVIFDGPVPLGPNGQKLNTEFIPAGTWPPPITFPVTLQDASRNYLPRRANVNAPQSVPAIPPTPAGSTSNPAVLAALKDPTTVFCPQTVKLYPMPSADTQPNWAVIRASVTNSSVTPAAGLGSAVLQVVRTSDNAVLATGQTDANGEALLAVVGLTMQASTSGTGPVTVSTVAVTVTAYFDPSNLTQPPGWIANPDDILNNVSNPALKSTSQPAQLASGQELLLSFAIAV
jgi:hypothetical protein